MHDTTHPALRESQSLAYQLTSIQFSNWERILFFSAALVVSWAEGIVSEHIFGLVVFTFGHFGGIFAIFCLCESSKLLLL